MKKGQADLTTITAVTSTASSIHTDAISTYPGCNKSGYSHPQTSALHMDSLATHVVVAITIQSCVSRIRRLNIYPVTPDAPKEANHPGTPSPSTMDDVPVGPLTGSHATAHHTVASLTVLPTAPPTVHPPFCSTNLIANATYQEWNKADDHED